MHITNKEDDRLLIMGLTMLKNHRMETLQIIKRQMDAGKATEADWEHYGECLDDVERINNLFARWRSPE